MDFKTFVEISSKIKKSELPGFESQVKMSPPFRNDLIDKHREAMKNAKKAGVMALFYPGKAGMAHLVLILRNTYKGVHSAQVGFPGGRLEKQDEDLKATALRETEEEIGVPQSAIEVIKKMTDLYIPPSNFTVSPYLGLAKARPHFVKQDAEVKDIIEISVKTFLDEAHVTQVEVMTSLKKELLVPAFRWHDHIVWGATAMMLSEIKDLLKRNLNAH